MSLSARRLDAPLALLLAFASAMALAGCSADIETPVDRYALVIGVEDYQNVTSLSWPATDANEMAALLSSKGWTVVDTLLSTNAGLSAIRDGIAAISNQVEFNANSTVLVYFSGHGSINDNTAYIIPYDAVFDDVATYISPAQISSWLGALPCKNKILILDSCYSGGFVDTGDSIDSIPSIYGPIDGDTESSFFSTALGNLGILLSNSLSEEGNPDVLSISAAGSEEFSMESDAYGNGVFTYYLMEAAFSGDSNNDGYVTASEAYGYAMERVKAVWDAQYLKNIDYWTSSYKNNGYVPDFLPHISGGTGDLVLYVNK